MNDSSVTFFEKHRDSDSSSAYSGAATFHLSPRLAMIACRNVKPTPGVIYFRFALLFYTFIIHNPSSKAHFRLCSSCSHYLPLYEALACPTLPEGVTTLASLLTDASESCRIRSLLSTICVGCSQPSLSLSLNPVSAPNSSLPMISWPNEDGPPPVPGVCLAGSYNP